MSHFGLFISFTQILGLKHYTEKYSKDENTINNLINKHIKSYSRRIDLTFQSIRCIPIKIMKERL